MALLEKLKVVANPSNQQKTAEQLRRNKLIVKLQEQMALVEAELGGRAYNRMRWATAVNEEGNPSRVQRAVRIKRWWFKSASGSVLLTVRYGAKPLAISNGMTAIEVGKLEQLPETIQTVITAVDNGELDSEIATIAQSRSSPKRLKVVGKK
jgi:hypothetical protein